MPGLLSAKTVAPKSNNKGTSVGKSPTPFPIFPLALAQPRQPLPGSPGSPVFSSSLPSHSGLLQQTFTGDYYLQVFMSDRRPRDARHCLPARPCWRGSGLLSALMPGSIQTRPPMRRAAVPSFLTSEISPKGKTHGSKESILSSTRVHFFLFSFHSGCRGTSCRTFQEAFGLGYYLHVFAFPLYTEMGDGEGGEFCLETKTLPGPVHKVLFQLPI